MANTLKNKKKVVAVEKNIPTPEEVKMLKEWMPVFELYSKTREGQMLSRPGTSHDDLRELIRIYNKYVDRNDVITIWCSECKGRMFGRLYEYTQTL